MITLHYVGLDVHKETIEVVAFRENETIPCIEKRIPNRTKSIKKVFGNLLSEGSVIACYEAGFSEDEAAVAEVFAVSWVCV